MIQKFDKFFLILYYTKKLQWNLFSNRKFNYPHPENL